MATGKAIATVTVTVGEGDKDDKMEIRRSGKGGSGKTRRCKNDRKVLRTATIEGEGSGKESEERDTELVEGHRPVAFAKHIRRRPNTHTEDRG